MNIITKSIHKPSQIVLGTFYRIVGHTPSTTLPIPPQVWQPRRCFISPLTGHGYFVGPLFMRIGTRTFVYRDHHIPFTDINVHGRTEEFHDIHLECGPDNPSTVYQVLGDLSYPEIQQALRHSRLRPPVKPTRVRTPLHA